MRQLVKLAITGAAVVALLAAVFIFLLSAPDNAPSEGVMFASGEPTDILSVLVSNQSGVFSFYFDFNENGFVLDDIPPHIADLEAFYDFMANCARLSAIRQVSPDETALREWGLDEPSAQVVIEFFDGRIIHLSIGGTERISGNLYASVQGHDGVYLLPRVMAEQFLLPKTQILSRFVTPQLAVSSPLTAIRDITFTGGNLQSPVTIQTTTGGSGETALAALSFGAPTHIVRSTGTYQLDQTYGVQILGSLFGIPAVDIVGYNLSGEDIGSYGFNDPYMVIEYDMINGMDAEMRRMKLLIAEGDAPLFYATLEGSGAVYLIEREAFLDIEYGRLMQRWFLTPLIMDLSAVIVETPDNLYRLDIDNSEPRNPVVTHSGQILDVDLFRSFFRLLTSAAHDGDYIGMLDPPAAGTLANISITYEYTDNDKKPDKLVLYPGDVRRDFAFVNGIGEFAIKDLYAQRVIEGCKNLLTGAPVNENWQ